MSNCLIVAKCIVNVARYNIKTTTDLFNSSKVYCKDWLQFNILIKEYLKVLILLYSMYFY